MTTLECNLSETTSSAIPIVNTPTHWDDEEEEEEEERV